MANKKTFINCYFYTREYSSLLLWLLYKSMSSPPRLLPSIIPDPGQYLFNQTKISRSFYIQPPFTKGLPRSHFSLSFQFITALMMFSSFLRITYPRHCNLWSFLTRIIPILFCNFLLNFLFYLLKQIKQIILQFLFLKVLSLSSIILEIFHIVDL